ncbi:MAG: dihydroneopterin aldolase [Spirosomaceae bacterium]|jgi:dihydroneopterin aldolase|nr:dihydroneopterin aldolase [Spirosomataceae bacterium]
MGTISLEGMEFFAYHGVADEEQLIGNKFSIDVTITTDLTIAAETDKLRNTINYEVLYKIVADVMKKKHRLLEHVAYQIIRKAKEQFTDIQNIKVSVSKFNPPVGGVCERSRVTISE